MKKIIDNLYLGDRFSSPSSTTLSISCAEEIFDNKKLWEFNNNFYFDDKQNYYYFNFKDYPKDGEIKIDLVKKAIKLIEDNIENEQIYVHCMYGINRSASIVFMYLVRNNFLTGKDYYECQKKFWKIYNDHSPNPGWHDFLEKYFPYNF